MKNFKRALAALAAAVMVLSMAACGEKKENEDSEKEETSSAAAADEGETEESQAETEAEESEAEAEVSEAETEESEAESEAETEESVADESAAEADPEDPEGGDASGSGVKFENGVLTTDYYTITVDESKWTYQEGVGVDGQFIYNVEVPEDATDMTDPNVLKSASNFNIVSMNDSIYGAMSPADYAEGINSAYAELEGATINDAGAGELNGYETYEVDVTYAIMEDINMTLKQLILSNDGTLVVISYGAIDSVMDELQPDFDEAISTFTFV